MTIYNVLRHRATVQRYMETNVDGMVSYVWTTIATDVSCLLDAQTPAAPTPTYTATQQQTADRAGLLLAAPTTPIKAGDRVTGIRGFTGRFLVGADPALISTLVAPSHYEFRVSEVP
ncbi:hypothetical protein GCM10027047_33150 [Rhodococcus aerolatus]